MVSDRRRRRSAQPPAHSGHRARLLTDGAPFFDALEDAIERAEIYVLLETYIVSSDETGWRVAARLAGAARRGVEVCFLYDGLGSLDLDPYFVQFLKNAGVKTLIFRPLSVTSRVYPWSRRNHRKSLIVDGRLGIVGGMNIADEYDAPSRGGEGWRDTSVEIEGPAVADLEASFRWLWSRSGGEPIHHPAAPASPPAGEVVVRFTHNFLRKERAEIRRDYLDALAQARRSVRIENAYFIPDRRIRARLRRLARQGIAVEVIVAGNTDVPLARLASRSYYPKLLESGVRIFEWNERVLHAKTAVIDGRWATVGSSNLDYFSSFRNLEVNAILISDEVGREMETQFAADRARSREVTLADWKRRPWFQRLFDWLFRQLARGY